MTPERIAEVRAILDTFRSHPGYTDFVIPAKELRALLDIAEKAREFSRSQWSGDGDVEAVANRLNRLLGEPERR